MISAPCCTLADIEFLDTFEEADHPRYKEISTYIISNVREFSGYHQVFERLVAERCLMTGLHVHLEEVSVAPEREAHSLFAHLVGVNQHSDDRVALLHEFLSAYECQGPKTFLDSAYRKTGYYDYLLRKATANTLTTPSYKSRRGLRGLGKHFKDPSQNRIEDKLRQRVVNCLTLYSHMKQARGLVPKAKQAVPAEQFRYYDFPWAIDYFGTLRKRDGAHRRAIANYLGLGTLPHLVVRFTDISSDLLSQCSPYVRRHFPWYRAILSQANQAMSQPTLPMHRHPEREEAEPYGSRDQDSGPKATSHAVH